MSGELPDHMSPYVFFIVFNDTTFIPYGSNETSHVKTHFRFHFCCLFSDSSRPYAWRFDVSLLSPGRYPLSYIEVLRSACLYVCPLACDRNHTSKLHEIFSTCYLTCGRRSDDKVTLSTFGFVDDITLSRNVINVTWTTNPSGQSPSLWCMQWLKWCTLTGWRGGATVMHLGLRPVGRGWVQILLEATLRNNLRQVVYMCLCHQAV